MVNWIEKIRRRKLAHWALGYVTAAWLFLEIFAFVADRFGWQETLTRGATIILGVGFFLTLVLAWYHGEKGTQQVSGPEKALIGALVIAGGFLLWTFAPASESGTGMGQGGELEHAGATRFLLMLPEGETLKGTEPALAISRDGTRVAYASGRGDSSRLYVRELNSFDATPIPGTEGARAPFFSPDGEWVGFFAGGTVKKVSLAGGSPQTLVENAWTPRWESVLSGVWESEDVILLSYPGENLLGSSIWQLSADGGTAQPLTEVVWEENHFMPQPLPGGEWVLFSVWGQAGDTRIVAVSTETGEQQVVVEEGTEARYLNTGHLVYQLGGDLWAAPFDAERLEMTAPAVPVVEGVLAGEFGTAQYSVSENGTLAYVPASVDEIERTLVWMDLMGHMEPIPGSLTDSYTPRLSPDGEKIVFQRRPDLTLWLMDLDRGAIGRVTNEDAQEYWHIWTPDGTGVVFNSDADGGEWLNLWIKNVGDPAPPTRLTTADAHQQPQGWSPDGEMLVYTQIGGPDSGTGVDIWTLRIPPDWTDETDLRPEPFIQTEADEFHPAVSPDGRWMAYVSNGSGRWEVYIAPFPEPGPSIQVSTAGGAEPNWSPDGRTLYYRSPGDRQLSREMFAVSVTSGPPGEAAELRLGTPELLFDGPFFQCSQWGRSYDLSPEGDRFLMIQDKRPELTATQINVVVNWFSELPDN